MSSSCSTLRSVSHRILSDIIDAWERPRTMCERFAFSVMPEMYRLHVCVDLSFYLSGKLVNIFLLDGCIFFTGVPGNKKCPVAPVSAVGSGLEIYITDVKYAVSICLLFRFFDDDFFVVIFIIGC